MVEITERQHRLSIGLRNQSCSSLQKPPRRHDECLFANERVSSVCLLNKRAEEDILRSIRPSTSSLDRCLAASTWLNSGTMVSAECPPMTSNLTSMSSPCEFRSISARNASARTTSRLVTPNRRLASNASCFLSIAAASGTKTLIGLETITTSAFGQIFPQDSIRGTMISMLNSRRAFRFVNLNPKGTKRMIN